jgi:glycerol kinase
MILSIDQGTTGSTVLVFDHSGAVTGKGYSEFKQHYPQPGWVEHCAEEILAVTSAAIKDAVAAAQISMDDIAAIGITNQRETFVVWDRHSGKPLYNAIVWQCRRSAEFCEQIKKDGKADWIHQKTGLVVDAYFSATKLKWFFDEHPEIREKANHGDVLFGTVDSWLIWNFTRGEFHVTDITNASRTMLFNIKTAHWDKELLDYFDIPKAILPTVIESVNQSVKTSSNSLFGKTIPIAGVVGDQQAALVGQGCWHSGMVKNTYGTGCFMLMYTDQHAVFSDKGLLTTIACDQYGKPAYALEGSVFIAGAGIQWLRDELQLIDDAAESEAIAESIEDTKGVYIVPAFVGLGAPYWDMNARGTITGLTRGSGRKEIVRAALEAIAFQSKDLVDLMQLEAHQKIKELRVDGGAVANNFLMQFQANLLDVKINRPELIETTAFGAAYLAAIGSGFWDPKEFNSIRKTDKVFEVEADHLDYELLYAGWKAAVNKARL